MSNTPRSPIGHRIQVTGTSCAGKSTLGAALADRLGIPVVELDALNWLPEWVGLNETDPDALFERICEATSADAWVVSGSYSKFSKPAFWDRLETVVWLDLPMRVLLARVLARSWRRWRTRELLWGTNVERFWPQLAVWNKQDSLVWWIVTQHRVKRESLLRDMTDPRWSHIRFIRLCSQREVDAFLARVEAAAVAAAPLAPTRRPASDGASRMGIAD